MGGRSPHEGEAQKDMKAGVAERRVLRVLLGQEITIDPRLLGWESKVHNENDIRGTYCPNLMAAADYDVFIFEVIFQNA